jgi:pyruvate, water dikinase
VVLIDAAWGLGESVVAGTVDPDEYMVFKPLLDRPTTHVRSSPRRSAQGLQGRVPRRATTDRPTPPRSSTRPTVETSSAYVLDDDEILQLARWAVVIEDHYGMPMDIEWAKDGETGGLFIVQARPRRCRPGGGGRCCAPTGCRARRALVSGVAIGDAIATGTVCNLASPTRSTASSTARARHRHDRPRLGADHEAGAAIVTDHGGRTSHAAIVSRELGVAAVIGTGDATSRRSPTATR